MKRKNLPIDATEAAIRATETVTWPKLIDHIDTIADLSQLEKQAAKDAFNYLRVEFGEDFIRNACADYSPLMRYVINWAPWTRRWMINFVEELKQVQNAENYASLKKRIADAEFFSEALTVLHAANKLSKAGFEISFDPRITIQGKHRQPDLLLANRKSGEEMFAEVSELTPSEHQRKAMNTLLAISQSVWPPIDLIYTGAIHKTLSSNKLNQLTKTVREVSGDAHEKQEFRSIVIEGTIHLGIAPIGQEKILEDWSNRYGLKCGEFSGPLYNDDEAARIKKKIEKEQHQLPKDSLGLIIIQDDQWVFHTSDFEGAINEVEEGIYDFEHIVAAVITGYSPGDGERRIVRKNGHLLIEKPKPFYMIEKSIILFNEFCKPKASASILDKIKEAYVDY